MAKRESPVSLTKSVLGKDGLTPSIASTETTAATTEVASSQGIKRRRDENDDDDDVERPKARQRTESYGSAAWDWLLYPLKSFYNGFKQGYSSGPTREASGESNEGPSSSSH